MTEKMKAQMDKLGRTSTVLSPKDIAKLPSPRVLRPHATLELLHPELLNVAKVYEYITQSTFFLSRNKNRH